jgi:hypothetical protein
MFMSYVRIVRKPALNLAKKVLPKNLPCLPAGKSRVQTLNSVKTAATKRPPIVTTAATTLFGFSPRKFHRRSLGVRAFSTKGTPKPPNDSPRSLRNLITTSKDELLNENKFESELLRFLRALGFPAEKYRITERFVKVFSRYVKSKSKPESIQKFCKGEFSLTELTQDFRSFYIDVVNSDIRFGLNMNDICNFYKDHDKQRRETTPKILQEKLEAAPHFNILAYGPGTYAPFEWHLIHAILSLLEKTLSIKLFGLDPGVEKDSGYKYELITFEQLQQNEKLMFHLITAAFVLHHTPVKKRYEEFAACISRMIPGGLTIALEHGYNEADKIMQLLDAFLDVMINDVLRKDFLRSDSYAHHPPVTKTEVENLAKRTGTKATVHSFNEGKFPKHTLIIWETEKTATNAISAEHMPASNPPQNTI